MAKIEIPSQLVEQIQRGNCVLFLGAGISASTNGIPSGRDLSKELAEKCEYKDGDMTLSKVAQYYEMNHGRQALLEYVCNRIDTPKHKPLQTHKLIAKMPFKTIVTTNYDTLMEQALQLENREARVIVDDEDVPFSDETRVSLIKMHGDVRSRESIVVTEDDYATFFSKRPILADALSTYAATKTLLFLGYGLADANFLTISSRISQNLGRLRRKAYAVQLRPSSYSKLYWGKKEIIEILDFPAEAFLKKLRTLLFDDDVIEQREAKAVLSAIDEVSGELIHRLANPLGLVRLLTMRLKEELNSANPYQLELLSRIKESTEVALNHVQGLRQAYYDHSLQPLDVKLSINNMMAITPIPESIMLTADIKENLPPVFMGAQRLALILRVLVENSIDAMPDGGKILIRGRLEKSGLKKWVKIDVVDNGTGIHDDQLEFVFQFGYSTKKEGRGFGLWWLRTVIEGAGGTVDLKSQVNKGTTFILRLPVRKLDKTTSKKD